MKILFLVNDLSGEHGWSVYAQNIIKEAIKEKHEIHAAVTLVYNVSYPIKQYPILSSPHAVAWNPVKIFKNYLRVRKIIGEIKPDIIHIVTEPYIQLFTLPVSSKSRIILTIHGTYARLPLTVKNSLARFFSKIFFKRALTRISHIISVSERTKHIFSEFVKISFHPKISVIHNSISTNNTHLVKANFVEPYHFITIGAVKNRKGIHEAIPILSRWANTSKKKVIYDVVGSFDTKVKYCDEVKKLANACSSKYFQVVFHGHVDSTQKENLLINATCYIHLERVTKEDVEVEGFGISIIEAASYGVPAIVAAGSATAEAVADNKSGFVIDLDNKVEVHDSIDRMILVSPLMQEGTISWANEHATNKIFHRIEQLYASLC